MDFRKLESYVAVVEAGQLTAAADVLYMSQSALSKQMSALSKELGVTLYTKTRNGIKVTPAGWEFYSYARRAVNDYHEVLERIEAAKTGIEHTIQFGSLPLAYEYGMEDALSLYWISHQQTEIVFHQHSQKTLISDLNLHKLDIAFVRTNLLEMEQYDKLTVAEDELVLVCRRDSRFARFDSVSLRSLRNENFVLLEDRSDITRTFTLECLNQDFHPRCILHNSRHRMILRAVEAGAGLSVLPSRLVNSYQSNDIIGVPFSSPLPTEIGLVWMLDNPNATFVARFANDVLALVSDR